MRFLPYLVKLQDELRKEWVPPTTFRLEADLEKIDSEIIQVANLLTRLATFFWEY